MELTVIERLITELTVFFTGRYNTQILSAITQSVTHLTLDTNSCSNVCEPKGSATYFLRM